MSRENLTHKGSFITKTLSAFAITCAVTASYTTPAAAHTTDKLDCKECVKSKQLNDGGIKGKDLKDDWIDGAKGDYEPPISLAGTFVGNPGE